MLTKNKIVGNKKLFFLIYLNFALINISNAEDLTTDDVISKIELVGTITGKHILAILRYDNKLEKIFQLNQSIQGYTLTTISNKSVTLTKKNKSSILLLIPNRNRKYFDTNSNTNKISIPPTYEYRMNRKTFTSLHADTQTWLNDVQMKIVIQESYFTGYRITHIQENSPAELLGLSEGDVIVGLNNTLIKQNPEDFITKIGQLKNAKQFILNMKHAQLAFKLKFIIDDKD
jgi:type II secretory pathway component PulC